MVDTPPVTPTKQLFDFSTPTPSSKLDGRLHSESSNKSEVFHDDPRSTESPRSFAAAAAATFSAAAAAAGSPLTARPRQGPAPTLGTAELEFEISLKDEAAHSSQVRQLLC